MDFTAGALPTSLDRESGGRRKVEESGSSIKTVGGHSKTIMSEEITTQNTNPIPTPVAEPEPAPVAAPISISNAASLVTIKQFLEAGVHFGHQTRRWNPKMARYIFGERNDIYIIDLKKTMKMFRESCDFAKYIGSTGKEVLFVWYQETSPGQHQNRSYPYRDALCQQPLARRHADQFHHRQPQY